MPAQNPDKDFEVQILPPRFTVELESPQEKREIFMSANLLTYLVRQCPEHFDSMITFNINTNLQQAFLTTLLAPRDEKQRPVFKRGTLPDGTDDYFSADEIEITVEQREALLEWAGGHVRNFLWRQLEKQAIFLKANQPKIDAARKNFQALQASQAGSTD